MFIYKIICLTNNKVYVGLTNETVERRFARHVADAKGNKSTVLHKAMRKHGIENFSIEKIAVAASYEELKALEKIYILQFESYVRTGKGYNMTLGGEGDNSPKIKSRYGKGKKRPKEHGQKISKALLGKTATGKNKSGADNKLSRAVCARKIGTKEVLNFPSATIAANVLNITTYGHINTVCKGKRFSTAGYTFWYADSEPKLEDVMTFTRILAGKEVTQRIGWRKHP